MNLRPRYSIRTMLVLVTLVGLYFGCWEVTKRLSLKPDPPFDLEMHRLTSPSDPANSPPTVFSFNATPGPFVISRERIDTAGLTTVVTRVGCIREYHFWFFGFTAKLPYERAVELPVLQSDYEGSQAARSGDVSQVVLELSSRPSRP